MGCNDGKDGAAIAVSDATAAMSDGTHAAPVSPLRRRLQPLQRNSNPPLRTDKKRREISVRQADRRLVIPAFERVKELALSFGL
jgi:hypothetical protein